jgi:phosphoglycolate phosphatase
VTGKTTNDLADLMVLFDWNGTIVGDADRARQATNQALATHGLSLVDAGAFATTFRLPLAEMFAGLGVPVGDLAEAERQWNKEMTARPASPRTGAVEMLHRLRVRGAHTGVVSAAAAEAVHADLAHLHITDLLDTVDTGAADKLHTLRARRDTRPQAVYVGDTEYDIQCALHGGFVAVGIVGDYCTPQRLKTAGAHAIIRHLTELVPFLDSPAFNEQQGEHR